MRIFGCLFKIFIGCVIACIAFVVVGVLLVDHFAVDVAAKVLQQKTGFTVAAGQQSISAVGGAGELHDVTVANPGRFAAKDFLYCNELRLAAEPTSILGQRIIIDEVVVDLDSFAMVCNKDGELNLMALKEGLLSGSTGKPFPLFTIKKFTLRLKTAKLLDFARGSGAPQVTQVNYDRTFSDVTETNYTNVEVQIGMDLSAQGYPALADALKNQLLDQNSYLEAAQGLGNAVKKLF